MIYDKRYVQRMIDLTDWYLGGVKSRLEKWANAI